MKEANEGVVHVVREVLEECEEEMGGAKVFPKAVRPIDCPNVKPP